MVVLETMSARATKVIRGAISHRAFMVASLLASLIVKAFHSIRDILVIIPVPMSHVERSILDLVSKALQGIIDVVR